MRLFDQAPLLDCFGYVDLDEAAGGRGELGHAEECLGRERVDRVRPDAHRDQTARVVVVAMERVGLGDHVLPCALRAGSGNIEDRRGEHAADPRLVHRLEKAPTVRVLLARGRDPARQQLVATEPHAPVDILIACMCLAGPDDLAQPAVEGQAVTGAAQQGHRGVPVGVDQPGHHHAAEVDDVGGGGGR